MPSPLTNDYKSQFALLLVVLKLDPSAASKLNYSSTLIEWSTAAYLTEGKIEMIEGTSRIHGITGEKEYKTMKYRNRNTKAPIAECINDANEIYNAALDFLKMSTSGRKEFINHGIYQACHEIDKIMYPLALSEGILDLKDVVGNAMMSNTGWSPDTS